MKYNRGLYQKLVKESDNQNQDCLAFDEIERDLHRWVNTFDLLIGSQWGWNVVAFWDLCLYICYHHVRIFLRGTTGLSALLATLS